ncbi:MAG: vWA domain-containing protein [Candidatus Sericytochromatia bacterium]
MLKDKLLKNSLILLSVSLISSCATSNQALTTTSPQNEKPSNSVVSNSSKDESKKPEPYISKDDSIGVSETFGIPASDSSKEKSLSAPSSLGRPTAEIVSDMKEPMPKPMATSAPSSNVSMSDDMASSPSVAGGSSGSSIAMPPTPVKRLSAGDIDDNLKFSDYLNYLNSVTGLTSDDIIKMDVSDRYIITVKDKDGKTVPDASIKISSNGSNIFNGKTYSNGKALFMPLSIKSVNSDCQQQDCNNSNFKVTVSKNNEIITRDFSLSKENKNWDIQLNNQRQMSETINLDLTFLVDATGSMGDEIASIQKTIKDISTRIKQLSDKNLNIRYSLISYKDRNDAYRVKRYDFTTNLDAYQEILNELTAGGGGDYKESVNEGLSNAVSKITWTSEKEAVRLIFLIGDAPPHLDYSDDIKYPESIREAVKQGIKIYPVAASGLSPAGEYIFRQLAQFTYSRFLFLTYGGDEQTPGTTPHNVGSFGETNLDDLVVKIVKEEITQFSNKSL